MLCCIVGEGALSSSRPLHGTLERPNSGAPAKSGVVKEGGVKKTSRIRITPNGMIVYMCVGVWVREEDGTSLTSSYLFWVYLPGLYMYIFGSLLSRQVLDQDNYSPIPVSTEQEYRHYTSQFPMQDPELEKVQGNRKRVSMKQINNISCMRTVETSKRLILNWCGHPFSSVLSMWGKFWIKSHSVPFSLLYFTSFRSPRSFPSPSSCQKSTANSKSSSTLV